MGDSVIYTGGAHQLAYNYTLRTINHKRSGFRHQREIAHKNLMLVDLICFLVVKSYLHLQRCRVGGIAFFAFRNRILYIILTQCKVNEFQTQMSAVIRDRRDIAEDFF